MSRPLPVSRQPMFWAALSLAAGILLGAHAWRPPLWWIVAAAVFMLAAAFFLGRRWQASSALALCGLFWVGALSVQLQSPAGAPDEIARLCDRSPVTVVAHAMRDGFLRDGAFGNLQQTLDVETESVSDDQGRETPVTAGLRLTIFYSSSEPAGAHQPVFHYGQRLSFSARLRSPRSYGNPGALDTRAYLLKQGIVALASAKAAEVSFLPGRSGSRASAYVAGVRRSLLAHMTALWGKEDGPMLAAMLIGEHSLVDRETRQNFQRTGTFHILVVSGMNVGLMAFPIIWLLRRLRAAEPVIMVIVVLVTGIFAAVADLGAPVLRATFMLWIYLIARLLYRDSRAPLNAVGISAVLLLIADPQSLFDPSFQMTFVCVLAIAGIGMPLLERTSERYRGALMFLDSMDFDLHLEPKLAQFRLDLRLVAGRLARFWPGSRGQQRALWVLGCGARGVLAAFDVLFISALMQVAMLAPMAVYAHRAALLTIPSNSVVVPLTALLTPIAMVAMLLSYIWGPLAWLPAKATALLLHGITGSVRVLGGLRATEMRVPSPGWIALLAVGAAFAVAMFAVRRRPFLAAVGLAALVCASAWMILWPSAAQLRFGVLEVTALDVGQGDSLLVISPEGRRLLVDAGGLTGQARSNFDLGEDVVSPYLWSRGFSRLEAVAITHAHSDHMGGMRAVITNFRPRELWIGAIPPSGELGPLLEQARAQGMALRQFRQGEHFDFGTAKIEVLAPTPDWVAGKRAQNNDTLVLKVSYAGTAALLAGDAETRLERLLAAQGNTRAGLLKVAHHGSATSTLPPFLSAVQPRYAVISVGAHNPFGYPRREVLRRLEAAGVGTFRTDAHGAVTFYLDASGVTPMLPNHR